MGGGTSRRGLAGSRLPTRGPGTQWESNSMLMHWCTARVNLAGQNYHIVEYGQHEPISWPEAQLIQAMHGEENVYDIKPCFVSDVSPASEKRRLVAKYPAYAHMVEQVFPGASPRMEMTMPGEQDTQPRADADGSL